MTDLAHSLQSQRPLPSVTVPPNRYLRHDGHDPAAAFYAGLELSGICMAAILILLAVYYAAIRMLIRLFPAHSGARESLANEIRKKV